VREKGRLVPPELASILNVPRSSLSACRDLHALRVANKAAQLMSLGETKDERAKADSLDSSFDQNPGARRVSRLGNADERAHVTTLSFGLSTSDHAVLTQGNRLGRTVARLPRDVNQGRADFDEAALPRLSESRSRS
jgi:hypothetical protein